MRHPAFEAGSSSTRADFPEIAAGEAFARFLNARITGISMGQRKGTAGLFDLVPEPVSFFERKGDRFVEYDVEAMFHSHRGRPEMQLVRSDDRYEIHAPFFRQRGFALDHLLVRSVYPVVR